jgi:hypothetical protein
MKKLFLESKAKGQGRSVSIVNKNVYKSFL